jgi:hypothetical protein
MRRSAPMAIAIGSTVYTALVPPTLAGAGIRRQRGADRTRRIGVMPQSRRHGFAVRSADLSAHKAGWRMAARRSTRTPD